MKTKESCAFYWDCKYTVNGCNNPNTCKAYLEGSMDVCQVCGKRCNSDGYQEEQTHVTYIEPEDFSNIKIVCYDCFKLANPEEYEHYCRTTTIWGDRITLEED